MRTLALLAALTLIVAACAQVVNTSARDDSAAGAKGPTKVGTVGGAPDKATQKALDAGGANVSEHKGDSHAVIVNGSDDDAVKDMRSDAVAEHLADGKALLITNASDATAKEVENQTGFKLPAQAHFTAIQQTYCGSGLVYGIAQGPIVAEADGPPRPDAATLAQQTQTVEANAAVKTNPSPPQSSGGSSPQQSSSTTSSTSTTTTTTSSTTSTTTTTRKSQSAQSEGAESDVAGADSAPPPSEGELSPDTGTKVPNQEILDKFAKNFVPRLQSTQPCGKAPASDDKKASSTSRNSIGGRALAGTDLVPASMRQLQGSDTSSSNARLVGIKLRWVYTAVHSTTMQLAYSDSPSNVIALFEDATNTSGYKQGTADFSRSNGSLSYRAPFGDWKPTTVVTQTVIEANWPTTGGTDLSGNPTTELAGKTELTVGHAARIEPADDTFVLHKNLSFPDTKWGSTSFLTGYRNLAGVAGSWFTTGTDCTKHFIWCTQHTTWSHFYDDETGYYNGLQPSSSCKQAGESGFLPAAYQNQIYTDDTNWTVPVTDTAISPTDQNATVTQETDNSQLFSKYKATAKTHSTTTGWSIDGSLGFFGGAPMGSIGGSFSDTTTNSTTHTKGSSTGSDTEAQTGYTATDWAFLQSHPSGHSSNGAQWNWYANYPQNLNPWDSVNGLQAPKPASFSQFWASVDHPPGMFNGWAAVLDGNDQSAQIDQETYNDLSKGNFLATHQVELDGPVNEASVKLTVADEPYWFDEFSFCDVYTELATDNASAQDIVFAARKVGTIWHSSFSKDLEVQLQCAQLIDAQSSDKDVTVSLPLAETCLSFAPALEWQFKGKAGVMNLDASKTTQDLDAKTKPWTTVAYLSSDQKVSAGFEAYRNCPQASPTTTTTTTDPFGSGSKSESSSTTTTPCIEVQFLDFEPGTALVEHAHYLYNEDFVNLAQGDTVKVGSTGLELSLPSTSETPSEQDSSTRQSTDD